MAIIAALLGASCGAAELKWRAGGKNYEAVIGEGTHTIASVRADGVEIAKDLDVSYEIVTGKRIPRPGVSYIFFDYPIAGKYGKVERFEAKATGAATRVNNEVLMTGLHAGVFEGDLVVRVYDGSPLIHVDAEMTCNGDGVAYAYEPIVGGGFENYSWLDNHDRFHREPPAGTMRPLSVRYRTIMGETSAGTLALFPPPHAYIFPRDFSTNFGYVQVGRRGMGLRQDLESGNHYVPWADAPKGKTQHMNFFLLPVAGRGEEAIEAVKRYTHGDKYEPVAGHITFMSHMHAAMTMHGLQGKPNAPEVKKVVKGMGVNVLHPAEFHGDGHPFDTGRTRLEELKAMFTMCREMSDDQFLMVPGEEANAYFGGHWVYLFPKPVYLTLKPIEGKPATEEVESFGLVHHPKDAAELAKVISDERGLAWATHPRIKGTEGFPERYKDQEWYKSDLWLGATWKAMPANLADDRLGVRGLDVLDDMNSWGQRKYSVGEVDTFDLDSTHEFYGHANVNYLKLDKIPTFDDYSSILTCLRKGDFFVTTGEVLIRSAGLSDGKVKADVTWTFPLKHAELVTYDGRKVTRKSVPLEGGGEFGAKTFEWDLDAPKAEWWRVEVWDVAGNGAFTQPKGL